ncbi:MAG: hydrolase [Inconstantimicrobium porci]|uniref:hydrolase n=1 Tax=Inconstantimicrobium porci TaxID=2652291 RepID=UPI002409A381|nr:hydrolase [Inconstantimicrobium porci]MDD6771775.1 hydrolase [Inconstantimicrobium porci]MDY5910424.1 hydrolase [Inconstantimicrobium porci]
MKTELTREKALELLREFNKESFHLEHALTVEGIMRYYAEQLGYKDEVDFWGLVGLLHDVDYEMYPDEHCVKAQSILADANAGEDLIHAVCSHGYGICVDIKPEHEMEKVLFTVDELSGLAGAAAKMRPSKSVMDMEVKSLKKKFKDKKFAAGCSRDVINQGAEMLGYDMNKVFEMTIDAMRSCEESVRNELEELNY